MLGGGENRLRGLGELKEEFYSPFHGSPHLSFCAEKLTHPRNCCKNHDDIDVTRLG